MWRTCYNPRDLHLTVSREKLHKQDLDLRGYSASRCLRFTWNGRRIAFAQIIVKERNQWPTEILNP